MNIKFEELVDIKLLQNFTDTLNSAFSLPSAIITPEGKVLTKSGWQELCTEFHRKNPETEKDCIESNSILHELSKQGNQYCIYKCPNGLINSSSPIIIDGQHVANVFTGQFFNNPPTAETEIFFRKQAKRYGFDEEAYLTAFRKVPVFSEDKHHLMLDVLVSFATMLSDIGLARLRENEKAVKLSESEERFRRLMDNSPDMIYRMSLPDGCYEYVSTASTKIFGFTPEEFFNSPILIKKAIHPDWQEYFKEQWAVLLAGKMPPFYEYQIIHNQTGETRWLHQRNVMIYDDAGRPQSIEGIVTDITDRKHAEDALKKSEKKLIEAQRIAKLGHYVLNIKTGSWTSSNALNTILGIDNNYQKSIESWVALIHPDYKETMLNYIQDDILVQRKLFNKEYKILNTETRIEKWVHGLGRLRFDDNNNLIEMFGTIQDITERKQVEEALAENEEYVRTVLDSTADGILAVDAQGNVRHKNGRFTEMWRIPEELLKTGMDNELLGHVLDQLIDPNAFIAKVEELYGSDKIDSDILFFKDDRIFERYSAPLKKGNELNGRVWSFRDITKRKKAEQALTASEDRFRSFTNQSSEGIAVADLDGSYTFVNPAFCVMVGYSEEELLNMTVFDVTGKDQDHSVFSKSTTSNKGQSIQVILRRKDGSEFFSEIVGNKIEIHDETFVLGTVKDITERKKAEEALRDSEERFRTYIASAPDGIFITNKQGQYVDVNYAACKMTGYTKAELLSLSISDLIEPQTKDKHIKNFNNLSDTRQLRSEIKLKRKDDSVFWSSLDAVVLSEDRFMAFCSDITETKRLQEQESRAARLETAGTIAGQVAHDFNNLLAPLIAYPEIIRDELPKNHPILQYIDQIETAALKIAEINQDLLTMGRRGHYNQSALNLNVVVQQAITEMEPCPETLVFEANLCEDLKDVFGGGAQLHRMVSNLLHNAKEAMQDIGQISVKTENYYVDQVSIAYGYVPKGEYIKLTITDTGCGIPDNIIQKIFDPFFTSKTTDKRRGSGLGMSVVDAVIKDHHGYIDLSTKIGEGTSFYIYLPMTLTTANGIETETSSGGDEKVLVVDDDDIQRQVSTQVIKKLGYQVSTVSSGEGAVEYLKLHPQDLIVLDMVMPGGIDGAETYRQLLEINPDQKAIILSGFSESGKVLEAQKLGAGAFVKKPVSIKGIASAIRSELDRARTTTIS